MYAVEYSDSKHKISCEFSRLEVSKYLLACKSWQGNTVRRFSDIRDAKRNPDVACELHMPRPRSFDIEAFFQEDVLDTLTTHSTSRTVDYVNVLDVFL